MFFAYALNLNLRSKAYYFIDHARRKTTTLTKAGRDQTKKYKGRFFSGYVEVTCLMQG